MIITNHLTSLLEVSIMRILRFGAILGLVVAFALASVAEGADKNKKKGKGKGGKGLHGGVVAGDAKDGGTLTVKTRGKKGSGGKEEKVTLGKDTKIDKVRGKKGNRT